MVLWIVVGCAGCDVVEQQTNLLMFNQIFSKPIYLFTLIFCLSLMIITKLSVLLALHCFSVLDVHRHTMNLYHIFVSKMF